MLNEAGINKNTLKDMVKEVLHEEIEKATKQAINETDIDGAIKKRMDNSFTRVVKDVTKEAIRERTSSNFNRMTIQVDITDKDGTSSISR